MPQSRFRLLQGEQDLTVYTFGTHTAKHTFCRVCGVKPFYVPRSNPDGVNARCLDPVTIERVDITPFDGRNWEQHAGELAHLSKRQR